MLRGSDRRRPPAVDRQDPSGLRLDFDPEIAWLVAQYLRTGSRLLWEIAASSRNRLEPLYADLREGLAASDFAWAPPQVALSVEVSAVGEFEAGPLQLRGTVKNAFIDALTQRGVTARLEPEQPNVSLDVRFEDGRVGVAVDLFGGGMHRRGYRVETGAAPLRETLAAQILMLARWDARQDILLDPMCGSGTFGIEAALMAEGRPLAVDGRRLALEKLPPWKRWAGREAVPLFPGTEPRIFSSDIDSRVVHAAQRNAERAGVKYEIAWRSLEITEVDAGRIRAVVGGDPAPGLVVLNPPYGERIGPEEGRSLEELLREVKAWFRTLGEGWRIAVLAPGRVSKDVFGPQPRLEKSLANGSLRTMLRVYDAASVAGR